MAWQNEASIWVSSAPIAARNTARSRCSSADHQRSYVLRRALPPPLLSQELRRCNARDAKPRPLVLTSMARKASMRSPGSPLFRSRSMQYLRLNYRKRCVPNLEERILRVAKVQNCDVLKVQSNQIRTAPPPHNYPQSGRNTPKNRVRRLIRAYHSAP